MRFHWHRFWLAALGLNVSVAASLAAQAGPEVALGATASSVRVLTEIEAREIRESGTLVGVEARLARRWLALDLRYLQGSVAPDRGEALTREVAAAVALLSVRANQWLALATGAHIRSYTTPGGTERLFQWEARVRGDYGVWESWVFTYLELWYVLLGSVNVDPGFNGGQGGEVGLRIRLPRAHWWARLAYRIERFDRSTQRETFEETFEALSFTLEFRLR